MSEDVEITVRIREANLRSLVMEEWPKVFPSGPHARLRPYSDGTYRLVVATGSVPEMVEPPSPEPPPLAA